jgi:hypothetical protein
MYADLKGHAFFASVSWGNLADCTAPYIPEKCKFPSCTNMRDGSTDEWLDDGEATPILPQAVFAFGSSSEEREDLELVRTNVDTNGQLNESISSGGKWQQFLESGEKQLFTGIIWKRKVFTLFF